MVTLDGGSFRFQIGGKAADVVFIVMNPAGARKLVQDSVNLVPEASVAAGPVGRRAEGAPAAQLHAEILSCSRPQGSCTGVSLDGSVVKQGADDNETL